MKKTLYYVYTLQSAKDQKLYIGVTKDLKRRLSQHSKGEVFATRGRRPLDLIFYEAFADKEDALRREKYFKTDPGKRALKLMLRGYLGKARTRAQTQGRTILPGLPDLTQAATNAKTPRLTESFW